MTILAIEFSAPQRSVAVVQANVQPPGAIGNWQSAIGNALSEVIETDARAANALDMIEAALRQAQVEREQVDCLAVGIGPGSYNGIRTAIALAQGWHLAGGQGGARLLGISSAECVAAQAQTEAIFGRVWVVMDAQRNEFYLAGYEVSEEGGRETEPLRLATMADVQACEKAGGTIIGPEVTRWFPSGRLIFPHAATLGRLALKRNDFVPGEQLEPIYLRQTNFVKAPPPRVLPR